MKEPTANPPPLEIERRKATRFPVVVPIEAKWQEAGGKDVKENAQAMEVNASGGLLELKTCPGVGGELELTNLISGESVRARVIGPRRSKKGNVPGVAVELLSPSETFGGGEFSA